MGAWVAAGLAALVAAGCSSTRVMPPAPVEDRGRMAQPPGTPRPAGAGAVAGAVPPAAPAPAVDASGAPVKPPPPGIENLGKPGYYEVKPGETLSALARMHGASLRDLVRWNNLSNPNLIEVGQVLRVVPPGSTPVAAAPVAPPAMGTTSETGVVTRPVPPPGSATAAPAPAVVANPSAPAAGSDEDVGWIWPASGSVVGGFDEAKNKGLDIAGKAGDPVYSVGDGRVVYAGSGLRGYGNLVIVKHNNTYLSAYAHNQTLLVKEDQSVRKGQKIAEMGNSDADRVKLHFEIRRQGKPVDPAKYLPAR